MLQYQVIETQIIETLLGYLRSRSQSDVQYVQGLNFCRGGFLASLAGGVELKSRILKRLMAAGVSKARLSRAADIIDAAVDEFTRMEADWSTGYAEIGRAIMDEVKAAEQYRESLAGFFGMPFQPM